MDKKELNFRKAMLFKKISRYSGWALGVLLVVGLGSWVIWSLPAKEDIISRTGFHWHPELSIYIRGEKQVIPADIGIGAVHNPIHTHDDMGVIHLEFDGLVTKIQLTFGKFFKIWGKTFNKDCIFEFCNGSDGKVKMFVNGVSNYEFENYLMRDGDKIEIRYE